MLFSDFPMYEAIYEVRNQMIAAGESPGTEAWYVDDEKRMEFCRRVVTQMVLDSDQEILNAAVAFRKGSKAEGTEIKKLDLLMMVAKVHGRTCFYAGRGFGACSADVHLDRLVPGSRGGKYTVENCVVSCGRHNSMRSDRSMEEFLSEPTD